MIDVDSNLVEFFGKNLAEVIVSEKLLLPPGLFEIDEKTRVSDLMTNLEYDESELLRLLQDLSRLSQNTFLDKKQLDKNFDYILRHDEVNCDQLNIKGRHNLMLSEIDLKTFLYQAIEEEAVVLIVGQNEKKTISTVLFFKERGVLNSFYHIV